MTCRRPGWVLFAGLSLMSGSLLAAPDECLTYPDNPRVAACANQYGYGPSAAGPRPRSTVAPAQPASQPAPAGKDSELRTVAVSRGPKPATPPEPEPEHFAVDRSMLTNTVVAGGRCGGFVVVGGVGARGWGGAAEKNGHRVC